MSNRNGFSKQETAITTEYIKLDALLKFAGVAPDGAQAKAMILSGLVLVNNEPCFQRGKKLRPGDSAVIPSLSLVIEVTADADNLA